MLSSLYVERFVNKGLVSISLSELITYFNYQSTLFVVEYNNFICNKQKWDKVVIDTNDTIEIITIVGGG